MKIVSELNKIGCSIKDYDYTPGDNIIAEVITGLIFSFELQEDIRSLKLLAVLDINSGKYLKQAYRAVDFKLADNISPERTGRTTRLLAKAVEQYFNYETVEIKDHEGGNDRTFFTKFVNILQAQHFSGSGDFYSRSIVYYGTELISTKVLLNDNR